jgi:thiamine biosynthesis lipoprotein
VLSITLILAIAAALADGVPAAPAPVAVERAAFLMGTRLELRVEGESRQAALAGSEAALDALEAAEARLSTWRDDSELSRLNRSPAGASFATSSGLWRELRTAVECNALTAGAFDPSVGPLVAAWGLRTGGRQPIPAELDAALAAVGLDALELRDPRTLVRRRDDLVLEEGGFGKGAGLDDAIESLAATSGVTAAVLDLGGQVTVWRAPRASVAEPLSFAVADPVRRSVPVVALTVDRGSLSTTGSSERGITVGGRRYSHVLDPRTGMPATDIGSVTVWAPSALLADCLSTGLYVLGPGAIERWAAAHPEVGVLLLRRDPVRGTRRALASAAFAGRITPLVPDLEVSLWRSADGEAGESNEDFGRSSLALEAGD